MYAGKILSRHSLRALEQAGSGVSWLLDAAREESGAGTTGEPIALTCWSSVLSHPQLEKTRAAPLLVLGFPTTMGNDAEALATSALRVQIVEHAGGEERMTCLVMSGRENVIRLRCEQLLPVMRSTAIGALLLIIVCGDDVLFVEHFFDRRRFLEVCHELHLDALAKGDGADDSDDAWWNSPRVEKCNGISTYWPQIQEIDTAEEFYYGVVRSDESASI